MISYGSLYSMGLAPGETLGDVQRFRRLDRGGFNITDNPDLRFFKLLFYFYNDDESDNTRIDWFNGGSSGLLAPTWLENPSQDDYYKYNSAWAYLKNNYEEERAVALKEFITLLSQISTQSPWYFKEVSGVDEALTREKWVVGDERKKISIKCLNDSVDRRIESLLSLYRSIVWSHSRKCEVLPANLRKFDMGLFVFSGLVNGVTHSKTIQDPSNDIKVEDILKRGGTLENFNWKTMGDTNSPTSNAPYKYIEFHNCEISMDSLKSGFGTISNESGMEQEFTIDIYFDDCYENEYNPYLLEYFGDFFMWDLWTAGARKDDGDVTGDVPVFTGYGTGDFSTTPSTLLSGTDLTDITEDIESRVNNVKSQAEQSIKNSLVNTENSVLNSIKGGLGNILTNAAAAAVYAENSVINSITGGLGNIYGKGMGIAGAMDAVEQELSQQIKSLQSKVTGNIHDTTTKASRSLTGAVTAPVLGSIKTAGTVADTVVDSATNAVAKPALGTLKAVETASVRATETGLSYINEGGEYVANEYKNLGDIAYDSQVKLANQIGKNRLNAKLGKL